MSTTPESARKAAAPHNPEYALAMASARRVIDQNPRATLIQLCALAWLDGRAHLAEDMAAQLGAKDEAVTLYDNSATCQGCGVVERLMQRVPATAEQLNDHYCRKCLDGDQP